MKLLQVKNLTISLQNKRIIVNNISFEVNSGDVVGIIGQSGSGKSILTMGILGLLNKNEFTVTGSVFYKGEDITALSPQKRSLLLGKEMSLITQNPMTAFDPSTKILKQLSSIIRSNYPYSKQDIKDKCIKQLENLGLINATKIMESYPYELSGGMLQRVMIALITLLESRLIIADEITTAIDAENKNVALNLLKSLNAQGVSLIFISHDFQALKQIANKVIVLEQGVLVESGSLKKIMFNPQKQYTKRLLRASILNGES
ncbi:ABC transporter ATP-binding protein [Clostridium sp. 'deep sea']|uniref:ATP-binding cassette domain-containing protein n=1 Tax=Clostridium sp. 'deep sea' TaxID=2779445 RepID=UPI0018964B9F|nr:ABC transporter ATP-binding protein [Clostridium sp. 'deep sea']QOR36301.1 ABC transporter ATP-binding protein [Clostridium sp. 'deep sea']